MHPNIYICEEKGILSKKIFIKALSYITHEYSYTFHLNPLNIHCQMLL